MMVERPQLTVKSPIFQKWFHSCRLRTVFCFLVETFQSSHANIIKHMSIPPRVATPTPAATPCRRTLQSNTTSLPSVPMEDERDIHITQLQDRLNKMNEIIKKQNIEIKNLREMNVKLLIVTKESNVKKKKSNAQSKKYRDAALRMKYKIKSLKSDLLEEQSSTSDQMSFAVDQVGVEKYFFSFFFNSCSSS